MEAHRHLDPFPAFAGDRFGGGLQLVGDQAIEQRRILQPAAVVILEEIAQHAAAGGRDDVIARGGVPLHGRAAAHVDVGLAGGDAERIVEKPDLGDRRLADPDGADLVAFDQPDLKAAAIAAIERHGVGAGASRLVTGDHPLYAELEQRLARMKGAEGCCVFGSGYLANAGLAPVLAGRGDLILIDELAHSSLWTGARLSRAETLPFRHNDVAHLRQLLGEHRAGRGRVLIVTEGVFSMDGDRAPLKELAAVAQEFDAWLMADDAHDLDMGAAARAGVPLKIGTLSKALGAYGGYVCASAPVRSTSPMASKLSTTHSGSYSVTDSRTRVRKFSALAKNSGASSIGWM